MKVAEQTTCLVCEAPTKMALCDDCYERAKAKYLKTQRESAAKED